MDLGQETTSHVLKNIFKHLAVSIFESPDMSNEFAVLPDSEEKPCDPFQTLEHKDQDTEDQDVPEETNKSQVSRLEIEINKNQFQVVPVVGEVFLLLFNARLQGKKLEEIGYLMMTNYRVMFLKDCRKRVDLPFGLIREVDYQDKSHRVIFKLKYPHSWTFRIISPRKKYPFLKTFGPFYFKPSQIKNSFAFQHFLKLKDPPAPFKFNLADEYCRLKFSQHFREQRNEHFGICDSYSSSWFVPRTWQNVLSAAKHRKNQRLPILAYLYTESFGSNGTPLWISSNYTNTKDVCKQVEQQFLQSLSSKHKLEVFVVEDKSSKSADESTFFKGASVNYLRLEPNYELRASELRLIEAFLCKKTPLIAEIIKTGWYRYISGVLQAVGLIRNALIAEKSVLVRCDSGQDKSLVISSLVQIVLDPYFRTVEGFQRLIMRMFVHNGFPFASRLGQRNQSKDISPIFLQFLDCLSQLLNQNETCFEFNFKYLSKLANLMQNNIYGTFIANSPKEYIINNVEAETVSIWPVLLNQTTLNGNYLKNNGILQVSADTNFLRFWKEYFGSLISRKYDHYEFQHFVEENEDYLNIASVRIHAQNEQLREKIKEQQKLLAQLQSRLKNS